ncbi:MAG: tRNA (adenosine(37)-N6)-threonylcarbamoyltransferase complex ATPase subunit type 1 TsaE [Chloroflexi bacterium]|nr:tRNA (adenosine(37)-N6)-threonylcarbamoyltransferase complex ATPase subunit type 1 TsaE [Chloroflexota bacterium]
MGIAGPVQSPTFTLVNEHAVLQRGLVLYHVDLYRLGDRAEVLDLGLAELLGAPHAVCAVEWGERAQEVAPAEHLRLDLAVTGARRRRLRFRAGGPRHAELLAALREELGAAA